MVGEEGQLAVNQDIYVRAAFYRTKAIYWSINTHRTQLVYDSPSGRSGTGCRPIVIMGLVKARRKKCKAFRLWPFKRMPRTPAQGWEIDDTCLVKMMWMRNKYCITENELCSLVEWFIIQKILIKIRRRGEKSSQKTHAGEPRRHSTEPTELNV